MDVSAIAQIAAEQMADKSSHPWKERGNKYLHGQRVAKLALTLRKYLFPEDGGGDGILTAAAWFHDICNGEDDHETVGAALTRKLLAPHCSPRELDQICDIIAVHDNREAGKTRSALVKLHQDADLLDHFGTLAIWVTFQYTVPHDLTLSDRVNYMQEAVATDRRYLSEFHYDISRHIFIEKSTFVKNFTERFAAESDGEIWDWDTIIHSI